MKLTKADQTRLLAGNYKPLVFDTNPDCEPGMELAFAWSRPKRHCDPETGQVFEAPATPSAWIRVTRKVRQPRHWVVYFDVYDKRHLSLLLARGNGYTTDRRMAIDHNEAVLTDADKRRFAMDARAARAAQLERSEEARRRQERSIRSRLRDTLKGLSPTEQAVLLGAVESAIKAAEESEQDAA